MTSAPAKIEFFPGHYTVWDCYSHACGGQRVQLIHTSHAGEDRDENANQRIVWSGFAANPTAAADAAAAHIVA